MIMKLIMWKKRLAMIFSTALTSILHFQNPELLQVIIDAGTFAGVLVLIFIE